MIAKDADTYISPLELLASFVSEDQYIKEKFITPELLVRLFEPVFYTSLKSEEGQYVQFTITFFNHETRPTNKAKNKNLREGWSYIPFKKRMALNVDNLIKLSKAADPWSSSIAVVSDGSGYIFIYGLIDQALHQQSYINLEDDNKPEQPGIFQVTVAGIGVLSIMKPGSLIATLKQDKIIKTYLNVFQKGPVAEDIVAVAQNTDEEVKSFFFDRELDMDELRYYFTTSKIPYRNSLSRILNKIRSYKHGGAVLLTDDYNNKDLDIKYELTYKRIKEAIVKYKINAVRSNFEASEEDGQTETLKLHRLKAEKQSIERELKGAIRFTAAQSCVDGLIVIDKTFTVQGFGGVILLDSFKGDVYISSSPIPSINMRTKDASSWGTRHRTMFAYCYKYPDSLGFVISQDGDIRAVKRIGDKLIIWENISIQKI